MTKTSVSGTDTDNITATSATSDAIDSGQAQSPNHIEAVDALRGLAAVLVVLFHLMLVPVPNLEVSPLIRPLVMSGGSGVGLFFVVSAFTLCLSMASRKEKKASRIVLSAALVSDRAALLFFAVALCAAQQISVRHSL